MSKASRKFTHEDENESRATRIDQWYRNHQARREQEFERFTRENALLRTQIVGRVA